MYKNAQIVKRFSEDFKLKILAELSTGKYSKKKLGEIYGINRTTIAERINGILKDEFYLNQCFFSTRNASQATKNAIDIYNNKRLHLSLGYKTPNIVFKNTA